MATLAARSARWRPGAVGVHVTLLGTDTAWTPGTPGSPTFTVDGATITAQTVVSATVAELVVTVDEAATSITLGDPDNTTTATLRASGPAVRWFPGLRRGR